VGTQDSTFRDRITGTVSSALQPLPDVLAGWESGSAAFDLVDEYSDVDLNFLLEGTASEEGFYAAVESALETLSPIAARHPAPPGRYYKLVDGGDFLLVDVCIYRTENFKDCLDPDRHGEIRPLFDKGEWLTRDAAARVSQAARRAERLADLEAWFSVSQSFVRKAILRGHEVEALAAFWSYTLRPLVELLRMRHCPARWDFGLRYLHRDLPGPVYEELQEILFVGQPDDISDRLPKAVEWGESLLRDLKLVGSRKPPQGGD